MDSPLQVVDNAIPTASKATDSKTASKSLFGPHPGSEMEIEPTVPLTTDVDLLPEASRDGPDTDDFADLNFGKQIVRCICGFQVQDSFGSFVQCSTCDVLQHFICMGCADASVSDELVRDYRCEKCAPEHHAGTIEAPVLRIWQERQKQSGMIAVPKDETADMGPAATGSISSPQRPSTLPTSNYQDIWVPPPKNQKEKQEEKEALRGAVIDMLLSEECREHWMELMRFSVNVNHDAWVERNIKITLAIVLG